MFIFPSMLQLRGIVMVLIPHSPPSQVQAMMSVDTPLPRVGLARLMPSVYVHLTLHAIRDLMTAATLHPAFSWVQTNTIAYARLPHDLLYKLMSTLLHLVQVPPFIPVLPSIVSSVSLAITTCCLALCIGHSTLMTHQIFPSATGRSKPATHCDLVILLTTISNR
jgi:hypothetical protein